MAAILVCSWFQLKTFLTLLLVFQIQCHSIPAEYVQRDSGNESNEESEDTKNVSTAAASDSNENRCKREAGTAEEDDNYFSTRLTYAFDPVTNACYPVNGPDHKGPCRGTMKFFQRPDDPNFGFCDCAQELPTVYNARTGTCHLLFQQEFCARGQWLVANRDGILECKPDPCIIGVRESIPVTVGSQPVVNFRDKCYQIGESCDLQKEIRISDTFQPECRPIFQFSIASFGGGLSVPTLKCSRGTRWSTLTESCRESLSFDFS